MKRIFGLAVILLLLTALAVPVFAAPQEDDGLTLVDEPIASESEEFMPGFTAEGFIWDDSYYLDDDQWSDLEAYAEEISSEYDCGVYAVIVEDMAQFGYDDIEEFAEDFYEGLEFGYGESKDGIMLILSMGERDYDLDAFGPLGNTAFTDYGKEEMADAFLPYFAEDDWYNGFGRYLQVCEEYLQAARDGEPVDIWIPDPVETDMPSSVERGPRTGLAGGISGIIGAVVSFITCGVFKSQMKTARMATEAGNYVTADGVNITEKQDRFLYSNVVRERIPDNDSRGGGGGHYGGTTVHSSGHSHHSGKF